MAVTRREFITTLGMLASAVGIGQADMARVTEAFAHGGAWLDGTANTGWTVKPKVIWVHGAECTGCSTSLLSLFEDATGVAVPGVTALGGDVLTAQALGFIADPHGTYPTTAGAAVAALNDTLGADNTTVTHPSGHRTLQNNGLNVDGSAYAVNIADVLIDFIDLQYHETVMGMGGDGAYGYLAHEMAVDAGHFVLVVEGAVQPSTSTGYWDVAGDVPWCSIAADGTAGTAHELSFASVVASLAAKTSCAAVVAIGQCASYGGYPACKGPDLVNNSHGKNMTGAMGVGAYLANVAPTAAAKVINVPGCPTNPWWFTLTVVAWMVDAVYVTTAATAPAAGPLGILNRDLSIKGTSVDSQGRLLAVYGNLLHGKYCPRYPKYAANIFASAPGEDGCLKNIGCKGLSTMSSCGRHGWNNAQPQNATINGATVTSNESGTLAGTQGTSKIPPLYANHDYNTSSDYKIGGCCLTAGAPCMGCTEKGYPDAMTPFVVR